MADERPTEAVVTFHPQVWVDGRAVTGDNTTDFVVPIEDATDDQGKPLSDDTNASDHLADHPNAPPHVQHWSGPFYISISEVRG